MEPSSELRECFELVAKVIIKHITDPASWTGDMQLNRQVLADWQSMPDSKAKQFERSLFQVAEPFAEKHLRGSVAAADSLEPNEVTLNDNASIQVACVALQAAKLAQRAVMERFGTWQLTGLRDVKNWARELAVARELSSGRHSTDADAFRAAGVSVAAGKRAKRRGGS